MKKMIDTIVKTLYISFFALVSVFLLLLQFGIIRYNESPSMPYGFYIKAVSKNLKEGSVVLMANPSPEVIDSAFIIKKIDYIHDNKAYLKGTSSEEIFKRCNVQGLYSYDSDYFGLVDIENLIKLYPLLTWDKLL